MKLRRSFEVFAFALAALGAYGCSSCPTPLATRRVIPVVREEDPADLDECAATCSGKCERTKTENGTPAVVCMEVTDADCRTDHRNAP